ncbi:primosomal protein N' [Paenibacillus sp. y28]|uniref:primosomal protein N' n=1 Tax=Paenibacillus sp. y28 TaxID=3129110 RepID=UPI0030199077
MRIAKVIVDVPAKQTNRPFDYAVPPHLQPWIDIGSRVGITFGPRRLQGFVVELLDGEAGHESGQGSDASLWGAANPSGQEPGVTRDAGQAKRRHVKLKAIEQVLDPEPPLNKELVDLARWMGSTYICPEITAMMAMLPAALKANYERKVEWSDPRESRQASAPGLLPEEERLAAFIRQKGPLTLEALAEKFPGQTHVIRSWLAEGLLTEVQTMKDRLSKKTVQTAYAALPAEELTAIARDLPASRARQQMLLERIAALPAGEGIAVAELLAETGASASTVKTLAGKGWITVEAAEVFRDPYAGRYFERTQPLPLTPEQQQVYDEIADAVDARRAETFLLYGVTGSGKTEVYLQSIQRCLDQGREAIVLVPEISLTPQMVERFKGRFGDLVAVLHSRLSTGERFDEWRKIAQGRVKVAIGARSAIFAPFRQLGLIIIDEEHESSYKQEESPKYHAREVAVKRAEAYGAAVVLGSATPSLESYFDTRQGGGIRLLRMAARVEGRPLPEVYVVDLREELKEGNRSMFSRRLHEGIASRLEREEQMVLLLNRRGHSTFVKCRSCGYVSGCPHCDISLTYHQVNRTLRCHYCGYTEQEPAICPECGSTHIRYFGTGTQRVEEELAKLFPGIRVIRMDVDTTTEKGSHEKWLTLFRERKADVLLGTQMVAKGLDFPHVTLVGVIAADTVLNLPDFRSAEKTFQLLTQVAGRAGRHHLPGEVVIQTYTPEHYSIEAASRHDYGAFVQRELEMRRTLGYPPYCRLILVTLTHEQLPLLMKTGERLAEQIRVQGQLLTPALELLEVLGPVASPIPRIKDRYRFQCLVKYRGTADVASLVSRTADLLGEHLKQHKLQIGIDVNPQVMM